MKHPIIFGLMSLARFAQANAICNHILRCAVLLGLLPVTAWAVGKEDIIRLKEFKPYEGGDFFGDALPEGWEIHKGQVTPSQARYREGKSALRWDWKGGAWIRIGKLPYGAEENVRPGEWKSPGEAIRLSQGRETEPHLILWTYREDEAPKHLFTLWLMHEGKVLRFPFDSVTAGSWRGLRFSLRHMIEAKGMPEGITLHEGEMALIAPQVGSGSFWLDRALVQRSVSDFTNTNVARDEQAAWLPPTVYHWKHQFDVMQMKPTAGITATAQEVSDVEALHSIFIEQVILSDNQIKTPGKKDYLSVAKRLYAQYGLRRDGKVVQGLPMGTGASLAGYPGEVRSRGEFSSDWRGPLYQGVDTLFISALLAAYHTPGPESRQIFIDVVDYMHYNGFDAGSSGAINYGHYYAGFNWVVILSVLVEDILKESGRLERFRQWARYVSCTGDIYDERDHNDRSGTMNSTDVFGEATRMRLASILLDDDPQRRAVDVKYYLRLLRKQLAYNVNGCADVMKPDHSVWHHAATLVGYWSSNWGRAANTIKAVKLSPFGDNADFKEAYWRYAKGLEAFDAFNGNYVSLRNFLADDARLGKGLEDLRLLPADGKALSPQHRILLSYNWGHFAGYFRNGTVWNWTAVNGQNGIQFPLDAAGSFPQSRKITFPGYQPIHAPGATLPLDPKKDPLAPGKKPRRAIRERDFTGSLAMDDFGILSYRFADPNFPDVQGVSSKFVIDDIVVCLGAGITSGGAHPLATTIMQAPKGDALRALADIEHAWHDEKQRLAFAVLGESSMPIRDREQADSHVIFYDHGIKPSGDAYQYGIVLDADESGASARVKSLRDGQAAKILANSKSLQSVVFGKYIATAAFEKQESLSGSTWLAGIDAPGLIMLCDDGDSIQLSFVDPRILIDEADDYFRSGKSALRTVRLRFRHPIILQGHNQADYKRLPNSSSADPRVDGNVLQFDTNNAFTHLFRISK